MSKINSVAWSLEIEFQFYVLAPILTYVFKIKKIYIRRITILCAILACSIIQKIIEGLILPTSLLSFAQFFFTGFLLLDIYLNDYQQSPNKNYIWDIVSVISWVSVFAILYMAKSVEGFIVIPMFTAYCAAFKGIVSNRLFCHPLIYTIGGMCYTIYLYHYTLISAFGRFFIKIGIFNQLSIWQALLLSIIIMAPITIFICSFLFILIEKPCMKKRWYIQYLNMRNFKIINP